MFWGTVGLGSGYWNGSDRYRWNRAVAGPSLFYNIGVKILVLVHPSGLIKAGVHRLYFIRSAVCSLYSVLLQTGYLTIPIGSRADSVLGIGGLRLF